MGGLLAVTFLLGMGLVVALAVQPWSEAQAQNISGSVDPEQASVTLVTGYGNDQLKLHSSIMGSRGATSWSMSIGRIATARWCMSALHFWQ